MKFAMATVCTSYCSTLALLISYKFQDSTRNSSPSIGGQRSTDIISAPMTLSTKQLFNSLALSKTISIEDYINDFICQILNFLNRLSEEIQVRLRSPETTDICQIIVLAEETEQNQLYRLTSRSLCSLIEQKSHFSAWPLFWPQILHQATTPTSSPQTTSPPIQQTKSLANPVNQSLYSSIQ